MMISKWIERGLPFLLLLPLAGATITDLEMCSVAQQRDILPRILNCSPREEVVHLTLPNETYIHIVPNHVTVRRCGGSCLSRYQSCIPSSTRKLKVDVLLIPRTNQAGATESVCAEAQVEEHLACGCGCRTTADQCIPGKQRFVPNECRCVCANDNERTQCIERGWYWNPSMCQCTCRNPLTFPQCPTGYRFDGEVSCSCVNTSEFASTVLEILILIMTSTMVMTIFGLIHCYRTKTGLFQLRAEAAGQERTRTSNVTELRALFRALSNPGNTSVNWLGYEQIGESRPTSSLIRNSDSSGSTLSSSSSSLSTSSSRTRSSDAPASANTKLEPLMEEENSTASKE